MNTQQIVGTLSVTPELERQIKTLAKKENKKISDLLREALRMYQFQKDWAKIRRWGDATAKKMGITSYEDIERIAG